jgi:hypothetical protein
MPHKCCPIELQYKVELLILLEIEKLLTFTNYNSYVSCSAMRGGALTFHSAAEQQLYNST